MKCDYMYTHFNSDTSGVLELFVLFLPKYFQCRNYILIYSTALQRALYCVGTQNISWIELGEQKGCSVFANAIR